MCPYIFHWVICNDKDISVKTFKNTLFTTTLKVSFYTLSLSGVVTVAPFQPPAVKLWSLLSVIDSAE